MIRLFLFAPEPNYKLMRSPCQSVGLGRTRSEKLTNAFAVELGADGEKRGEGFLRGLPHGARERIFISALRCGCAFFLRLSEGRGCMLLYQCDVTLVRLGRTHVAARPCGLAWLAHPLRAEDDARAII